MRVVILGLSITSSWGNGHATMFRGLVRALTDRGHAVHFLERDTPWYYSNRDMPQPPFGRTDLYYSIEDLRERFSEDIADADLVMIGSFVPEGIAVADWALRHTRGVKAFYDIDTPVTLGMMSRAQYEYLAPPLIPRFDLYLSFTGGPILRELEQRWGAKRARPFYCAVDPDLYYPEQVSTQWDLGYLGTYSPDRQPPLEKFLINVAQKGRGKFIVAGSKFPEDLKWPDNVERVVHLSPELHRNFYCSQRYTLNVTRADMVRYGYAPSVRLFEAAGCGTPAISDWWPGLDEFFVPGKEIAVALTTNDVMQYLWDWPQEKAQELGHAARKAVMRGHTMSHRAQELEQYVEEVCTASVA